MILIEQLNHINWIQWRNRWRKIGWQEGWDSVPYTHVLRAGENDPRARVNRSNVNFLRLKVFFSQNRKQEANVKTTKNITGCHGDFPELSQHCLNLAFLLAQSIFNYFNDIWKLCIKAPAWFAFKSTFWLLCKFFPLISGFHGRTWKIKVIIRWRI